MSGAHEGCSQGKSVRDREGSKHSTAATLERVYSEAAVLPQDFEDTVHARQLKALCRRVGRRMSPESSRSGTLTFNGTHASERGAAARKSRVGSRIAGVRKFCRISFHAGVQHVSSDRQSRSPAARDRVVASCVTRPAERARRVPRSRERMRER